MQITTLAVKERCRNLLDQCLRGDGMTTPNPWCLSDRLRAGMATHWVDGCLEALKAQTYRPLGDHR